MKIKKAVIPAAGLGTRFLPVTKSMPKEMLPIIDTPAIHYVVKEAVEAGLDDVIIITGRGKRAVEDYFDESPELEMHLKKNKKDDLLKTIREDLLYGQCALYQAERTKRITRCYPCCRKAHRG